jgi:nucleoside-diphosphate-sugar epimerase
MAGVRGLTAGPFLVTGASGFVGRHLLEALHAEAGPRRVIALVRDLDAWRHMEWTRPLACVEPLVGAVTDPAAWWRDQRLEGLGGLFHLAALVRHSRRDAETVFRTNVLGTLNMVRLAASQHCRMIFVSTSGTVGCFRGPDHSADEEAPYCDAEVADWPYYRSKIMAERQARALADELGVELVIVRPPVLLGPADHRFRSSAPLLRYLEGRLPFLIRGGMHFADVRDVARALIRVMARPDVRPVYHLPGTVCSIEEFFAMVAEVSGRAAPRFILPFVPAWWLATIGRPLGLLPDPVVIEMASRYWSVSSRYAGAELDYRSRQGRETLADTVAWLRRHHSSLA